MLLLIDNYDSFTYNLYQYLSELGTEVLVRRNDEITPEQAEALAPSHLVISPGPCTPNEAGASNAIIERLGPRIPTLGVCLGHQCIGQVFGARVVRAPEPVHGKTAAIHHQGAGVLAGLPSPFTATRYHSLIVERSSLPDALEITAETDDGLIMSLRHHHYPIEGVQFHPESVLTTAGKDLLRNFLRTEGLTAEIAEDAEKITRTNTKEAKKTKVHEERDNENQREGNGGQGRRKPLQRRSAREGLLAQFNCASSPYQPARPCASNPAVVSASPALSASPAMDSISLISAFSAPSAVKSSSAVKEGRA